MNNKMKCLKSKITSKEYVLNGSLARQHKKCGKINCRCHGDKKYWHGPYWIWTRKENGKTVTKTLNKNQVVTVKKAIKEMKELNLLIESWRSQSLKEIEMI